MTRTDPTPETATPDPNAPSKARLLAAGLSVATVLVCLLAAGYWIYSFVGGPALGSARVIGTDDPPSQHPYNPWLLTRRAEQLDEPDGVHERRGNIYVKAGKYNLIVTKRTKGEPSLMLLPIIPETLISPEQTELRTYARRVVQDSKTAEYAHVTPEQVKKLRPLIGGIGMALTPEQETQLRQLWKDYDTAKGAARAAPQQALIDFLKSAAPKAVEPTRKALDERSAAIREVLSSAQLDALRNMGR